MHTMGHLKNSGFPRLLSPHRRSVAGAMLAFLAAHLAGLAFPWFFKVVVDDILPSGNGALLNALIPWLIVVLAVKACCGFISEYLVAVTGERVIRELRNTLYLHLQRLSVAHIENNAKGAIIAGLTADIETIRKFLFGGALECVYALISLAVIVAVMAALDLKLTLVLCGFLPAFAVVLMRYSPRLKARHAEIRERYAEMTSGFHEFLHGIRVISGFAREEQEARKFDLKQREIIDASTAGHKLAIKVWMGTEFISLLGMTALVWLGARAVIDGRISAGTLIALYSYGLMMFAPAIKLALVNTFYQEARASLDRVEKFLNEKPRITARANAIALKDMRAEVEFRDVSFGYDGRRRVLDGISLRALPGATIALAGKSGSGKTTCINLLLRFYDPCAGVVVIDGHDLRDIDLVSYRSRIAMVLQDDYLFDSTVRENISYGKPHASREEIRRAALAACAHEFITALPQGYDTRIGERGIRLSCGQRQRISIARAILRDPALVILDEATSSIDSETERVIVERAYVNLVRGRTTFMIAHRLALLAGADMIIVLDRGRIAENGAHARLLQQKGAYWRMWQQQTLPEGQAIPI